MSTAADVIGGRSYGDLAREQVSLQEGYKESIERRAMSVITSSSTIAALLFGVLTLLGRGETPIVFGVWAGSAVLLSILLFASASIVAVLVNRTRDYVGPKADALQRLIEDSWEESSDYAAQRIALTYVEVLRAAKIQNKSKAKLLDVAVWLEALAIVALAAAVLATLAGR